MVPQHIGVVRINTHHLAETHFKLYIGVSTLVILTHCCSVNTHIQTDYYQKEAFRHRSIYVRALQPCSWRATVLQVFAPANY